MSEETKKKSEEQEAETEIPVTDGDQEENLTPEGEELPEEETKTPGEEAAPEDKKEEKKIQRKKKTGYNRLGMLTIAVTVLMLLGILMMQSRDISDKIAVYDARAAALEQDLEEQKSRTEEIDKYKAYMKTDEYAEQVARERLGLVKDNEIIFEEEK